MAPDVSMCHTQKLCGWDIAYNKMGPAGTIHTVGYFPVKELAYSPQTSTGPEETIHKNCCGKPGRHNARISTQTMRNNPRWLTGRARRPFQSPTLNKKGRSARLHWVTVHRSFFSICLTQDFHRSNALHALPRPAYSLSCTQSIIGKGPHWLP